LEYDINFGALIRKKSKFPLDGVPLAVGLACILKQFHPSYTKSLLCYLGQFIRNHLHLLFSTENFDTITSSSSTTTKGGISSEVPKEILNILIFIEQLCHYSSIPRNIVHEFIPPYIFDALKFSTAK
jgi:WASH complex subunit strumpellin